MTGPLHEYHDDPRALLTEADWDVVKIKKIVQKRRRDYFPYLRGPKLVNYWIFILDRFTIAKFLRLDAISIIPDSHVQKASVRLGICESGEKPETVARLWKDLLADHTLVPVDLHPVLWNWSRNNFRPEV